MKEKGKATGTGSQVTGTESQEKEDMERDCTRKVAANKEDGMVQPMHLRRMMGASRRHGHLAFRKFNPSPRSRDLRG